MGQLATTYIKTRKNVQMKLIKVLCDNPHFTDLINNFSKFKVDFIFVNFK